MTPKEKAEELVNKQCASFIQYNDNFNKETILRVAKKCALLITDEIIDAIDWHEYEVPNDQLKYWFEVKQEIEKL